MLKIYLGQFSYFLEKYFGLTSIIWTILFTAILFAFFTTALVKLCEMVYRAKTNKNVSFFPGCVAVSFLSSYVMNYYISNVTFWNSKLQRVMSNVEYVLSFDTSRKLFLYSLNLPDNTYNQNHLYQIAMYLNNSQWGAINSAAGDGSWYFESVQKAVTEILKLDGYHMSLQAFLQGGVTYLPAVLIFILSGLMFIKKEKIASFIIFGCGLFSIFETFGGGIFTILNLLFTFLFWKWMNYSFRKTELILSKKKTDEKSLSYA